MREHGDVVRFTIGPPGLRIELYGVFHPDGVRRVLAGPRDSYSKRNRFYKEIAAAFGYGLLTSEGEQWERQRRLTQPLFTRKTIATYSDLMAEEAALLADRWSRNGRGVDANAEMVRLTLRVVGGRSSGTTWSGPQRCSTGPSRCSTAACSAARRHRWPYPSRGPHRRIAGLHAPGALLTR